MSFVRHLAEMLSFLIQQYTLVSTNFSFSLTSNFMLVVTSFLNLKNSSYRTFQNYKVKTSVVLPQYVYPYAFLSIEKNGTNPLNQVLNMVNRSPKQFHNSPCYTKSLQNTDIFVSVYVALWDPGFSKFNKIENLFPWIGEPPPIEMLFRHLLTKYVKVVWNFLENLLMNRYSPFKEKIYKLLFSWS